MDEWYVVEDGQQVGPVPVAELRRRRVAGTMAPDDLVWSPGMADWQPASAVAALAPPRPPPPVAAPAAAPYARANLPYAPYAAPAAAAVTAAAARGPAMLAYATPTALAAVPAAVIPPVRPDDGPFLKLGKQFTTGKGTWFGPTAVSPTAFYFVKKTRQAQGTAAGFAVGGLVGALVANAIDSGKADDTRTCTVAELPPAVRAFVSPKGKMMDKDVIVVPRETARRVTVGSVNNVLGLRVGDAKMTAHFGLFRNGSVKRWLTGHGWTINADLQPTAAPVFGHGFGRANPVAAKTTHPVLRVLYVLLAIALFALVVYLRVEFDNGR